ncbi:unnamed protein product [Peronospora belbahrii]|uniref:Uncharacterized protein n=1 Tax=Peronospora belbahrii TaxID=622444 RepID=A0AAU9KUU3_9STRA|nr:unnamed protein product [Peronospora belbahrii]
MLDLGISDFVETVSVEDNSPGRGPRTVDSGVENPLDGTHDMCHENDVTSLNTVSDASGCKPRCQDATPGDVGDEVLTLEGRVKSQMDVVFEYNEAHAPNDEEMTLEQFTTTGTAHFLAGPRTTQYLHKIFYRVLTTNVAAKLIVATT